IQPTWFPYEIEDLTGVIKIGDGRVSLAEIEGHHGRSWLKCNGDGQYSDEDWFIRLNDMLVLSLSVDDDLIDAVPASLAPQVRDLQYEGRVNARGEMTLAGRYLKPGQTQTQPLNLISAPSNGLNSSTFSLAWDVQLDMTGARMMVGVPIENVFGAVKLVGQYDGQMAECRGELDVDSMTIYNNQVTSVTGPIWLDNDRAAAGLFAQKNPDPKSQASPLQTEQPRSLEGTFYDGKIHLDAQISSGKLGEFYVQSTLQEAKLEAICREACPTIQDVAGRTFAAVRLAGNCTGTHTYRGDGTMQLRDATIYELPPVLALLKNLRLGRSGRSAFDSSNVNFTISGETIDMNRIELLGDAISLIGNGQLNMDRKLDLNFYSIVGRNRFHIPVVSELVHAGSQRALWIKVNGTLDNPKMTRTVLPQLNDSLRQLFQSSSANGPHRVATNSPSGLPGRPTFRNFSTRGTNNSQLIR
ncbi:AsmA-like C-terminal region-containing protein, partial [Mariniblastus sp.]|nr:AsmA-like C-terminal region-containing protein [Mariniblastus sp.]